MVQNKLVNQLLSIANIRYNVVNFQETLELIAKMKREYPSCEVCNYTYYDSHGFKVCKLSIEDINGIRGDMLKKCPKNIWHKRWMGK